MYSSLLSKYQKSYVRCSYLCGVALVNNLQSLVVPRHLQFRILLAHNFTHILLKIVDIDAGHLAEESAAQRRGKDQNETHQTGLNRCICPRHTLKKTAIGQCLDDDRRYSC